MDTAIEVPQTIEDRGDGLKCCDVSLVGSGKWRTCGVGIDFSVVGVAVTIWTLM